MGSGVSEGAALCGGVKYIEKKQNRRRDHAPTGKRKNT
jgi:hypothetical protein